MKILTNKKIKYISIVLIVCVLLATILIAVCRNNEVLRIALGNGIDYYMVLYENGDFVVEYGMTATSNLDISKKPYIEKRRMLENGEVVDYPYYSRVVTKLDPSDVERIKEMAKDLKYVVNDTESVFPPSTHVNAYYKGKKIWLENLSDSPQSVQRLVEELIKLSPMEVVFFEY